MAWAARLRGAATRALLLPLLLLLLPPPPLLARAPRSPDAHRRHPVRRGPQPWREAPPSSPAPAPTAQEAPQSATGPRPPRCGVPDPPDGPSARNRQKRFVLSGGRWEKTDLTYRILRFPWQLVREQVRQTVAEALQVWSDVTPLTFTEVHEGHADIIIDFTRYWHGDNLPFDGPGGILAHAFFPKTHREGDVHFDYDETWTIGDNQGARGLLGYLPFPGTDLLQVAAHEFGHVLGLQHTTAAKALMSPFYTFRYPLSLSPDDRRGIQHLYGRPRLAPTSRPPDLGPGAGVDTNEIAPLEPDAPPDACQVSFDAVATIRGELFFFKAGFVWRLRGGRLQPGYPALASRHWQGLPTSVDAAFEDAQGHIWFFQGGDYWRFHPSTRRVDSPVPRRATDWRGVPSEIDAAFQDADGYAYFLRGRLYWKFDPVKVKALEGFPRLVGPDFFGCTEPANTFR
ncbi:stromelysin-3 isoform X4 [Balaenoptera acutorostrata]|uniref:Stromelysin-3 isoform X4 n=1 Tax=Balaenoptera acutorostrata TaxID=9767 RepID=A0ABM3RXK3_BALAC|nr:stromelysin-3 isoform X4 [Balaenoptera acutorostrata]